jgi:hypothetical protein
MGESVITNKSIPVQSELFEKGQCLLKAAHDYWLEYNKTCGGCAVVWLAADDGHFVLFTRGEYRGDLMRAIDTLYREPPLERVFERERSEEKV